MKKPFFKTLFLVVLLVFVGGSFTEFLAQCPMCRMAAESNLANGGSAGKGLNKGILYMLAVPYILISVVGYIWWRNNKKVNEQEEQISNSETGKNDSIRGEGDLLINI